MAVHHVSLYKYSPYWSQIIHSAGIESKCSPTIFFYRISLRSQSRDFGRKFKKLMRCTFLYNIAVADLELKKKIFMFWDVPLEVRRGMRFKHDVCPALWRIIVCQWLDTDFPNRWISRGGPINWPARCWPWPNANGLLCLDMCLQTQYFTRTTPLHSQLKNWEY